MNLNEEQKKAVRILDGPMLILAGPGTGKTQLLSARAANIMRAKNVSGESILVLTYTNAGAQSVKERLAITVGSEGYRISAETFHGFANSVILESEEAAAYIRERVQMENLEKARSLEYIITRFTDNVQKLRPFGQPYLYIPEIRKKISVLKNEGVTPEEFEKKISGIRKDDVYVEEKHVGRLRELSFIYKKYEELKEGREKGVFDERGRYDYDDMIMLAVKALSKTPSLVTAYRQRYKYIMVDEFQDTNAAQLELLFLLSGEKKPNLCCVGDDDQSIYRFQGASIANFRILKNKYPGIKVIRLKDNYRSTEDIIKLYSGIIRLVPEKERLDGKKTLVPKKKLLAPKGKNIELVKFSTEDEEVLYILKKVKELKETIEKSPDLTPEERKNPYNQIAILVRKRGFIEKLIDSFLRAGIPYATDGKENIGRMQRVRQIVDALRLARPDLSDSEGKDLALYRLLSCDFFEIDQSDVLKFIQFVNMKKRESGTTFFTEFMSQFSVTPQSRKPKPQDTKKLPLLKRLKLHNARKLHLASWAIHGLRKDADSRPAHDVLLGFVEDAGIYRFILREYEKNRALLTRDLRVLTSFINMVKNTSLTKPGLSVSELLDEIEASKKHNMSLQGRLVTATQDGVRIITAHAAKGLEFHTCIIPFCIQDKSWPLKPLPDRIPLPPSILKTKEKVADKKDIARLAFFDETRLFYVAASRAKTNLIFTSSPSENTVISSFLNSLSLVPKKNPFPEATMLNDFLREKCDSRDPTKEAEAVLRDLVKNLVLTPTKLNNFIRCRRKFFYDNLLLLPGRKRRSLVFGTCAHKGSEETYAEYKKKKHFPEFDFFRKSFERELMFQGASRVIESHCLAKLPHLMEWFQKERKAPVMPIELEKKKIITLKNGIIFSGKYDKVEFENEKAGIVRIIDYKTGTPDRHIRALENEHDLASEDCDDYLRQLVAYKMLYEKDTYEPARYRVSHGILVFLEPVKKSSRKYGITEGGYVNKKIAVSNNMVAELENLILEVHKQLCNLEFDKLPGRTEKKCANCAYDSMCWSDKI